MRARSRGRSRILMIGAGFLGGRTSEVGYCVGWCCASLSSLSMCISVVLPALSRPWVSGKGRREGARQGRRSRFEQCFCVASDRGRSRRVRRATGADRARRARAPAVDRGPTSTAIVTPRSGWTIARGIGRAGDPAGADRRVTVARPSLHQRQSSPSSRVWLDRGEAGRDRGTHQEENLGVLLPQPEAGEDIVEEIEEPHGRRRRSVRAEISSPRSESRLPQTFDDQCSHVKITSAVSMLS